MGKFAAIILAAVAVLNCAVATEYQTPPPTFEAKQYTVWSGKTINNSKRGEIYVPFTAADGSSDMVSVLRVDLVGDNKQRGYAHGYLLAKEIVEFTGPKLDKYFSDMVLDLDISVYPEPLQAILRVIQIKGAIAAPAAFKAAMKWVWEKEQSYVPQYILDEMASMAEGVCAGLGTPGCDVAAWTDSIRELNMLPELIRMACTAYGAWGKATATGKGLIQLRALDFGGGPFANYTVAAVYRDEVVSDDSNAFVSITFPGFTGVITGVSQRGIGVSEKVWMTYGKYSDLQPGSYDGEADVFVLRDILQQAKSKADAEAYLLTVRRTWAIWIGIGDYASNKFDLVAYQQSAVGVYTDETMPAMTGQPYLESIAYVDKHPQPSGDGPNGTLPTALADFYGQISLETSKSIIQYHQTGDLHIASYDFGAEQPAMYLAVGRTNKQGEYGPSGGSDMSVWKAYNRPYLKFVLSDLWQGL